jgi:N4-(beta-N-acetylglucosaminyl)-L-asparaginase
MSDTLNRRDFLIAGAAAGLAAAAPRTLLAETAQKSQTSQTSHAPAVIAPKGGVKPIVISSANGNKFKNGGDVTCVQKAFVLITQGSDVLDALIAGVNIVELDPAEDSVGYGGLPNAEGVVQLDSCCMHGPRRQAGGVGAIEGVRTPSLVAKAVMEHTDHHLLVGKGAQDFARGQGFRIEDDLNTEHSRALWLEWKRRVGPKSSLDPKKRSEAGLAAAMQMASEGLIDREKLWGTLNCNGINAKGEICGVTTTSGLAWKIPGRVGDSPILGAGLWVDGDVGAAGSIGRGEANLYNLSCHLVVETMRRGAHPKDAGMEALRRVAASTVDKRHLDERGRPSFDLKFYVLNHKGEHAAVSFYPGQYALCNENGPATVDVEAMFEGRA